MFRSSKAGKHRQCPGAVGNHPPQLKAGHPRRCRCGGQPDDRLALRFKDDATEVKEGYECGIGLGSFNDIRWTMFIETFECARSRAERRTRVYAGVMSVDVVAAIRALKEKRAVVRPLIAHLRAGSSVTEPKPDT